MGAMIGGAVIGGAVVWDTALWAQHLGMQQFGMQQFGRSSLGAGVFRSTSQGRAGAGRTADVLLFPGSAGLASRERLH